MPKNVLTMPGGDSSRYTHQYGVYSIQKNRHHVEPLCQDPNQYFALREAGGGAMHWLYQVVSAPSLELDPKKPLVDQIKRWHEELRSDQKLSVAQQVRLSYYMSATMKHLGGGYREVQLFYVLGPWRNDTATGSDPAAPLGPLSHGPRPIHPGPQGQKWYELETLLNNEVLPR